MSNSKNSDRIPTLTDIVQDGDASMENHFDGLFVDEQQDQEQPKIKLDPQDIDEIINEVVNSIMPAIERHCRNQLASVLKKYQS